MNKKKLKWGKILVLFLLLVVIVVVPICLYIFRDKIFTGKVAEKGDKDIKSSSEEKIEEYSFSMVAVGDALIHAAVYMDADVGGGNYDFKPMLTYVKPWIQDYDLKFYNQETVIGGKDIGLSHFPMFNSPDEIGLDMVSTGFNVVGLANNHTMDRGAGAAMHNANFWKKQDVYEAGSYASQEERDNTKIAEVNGITYAMLAYTYGTNGMPVPSNQQYLINHWPQHAFNSEYENYKAIVKKDIERIRDKVDFLMVSMHWGVEYDHNPGELQKDTAKFLSDLGVDVIIGHHPHVIQPIEFVGDTLVIYSLGNFLSAQIGIERLIGLATGFDVVKTVTDGVSEVRVENVRAELHYTYYSYSYNNFKVVPFKDISDKYLPGHQAVFDQFWPIVTRFDKNIKRGI